MSETPVYYDADEAAVIVHKTANWMKTHARAGTIPYTRIGRTVLWTPRQLEEIGRAGEQKPKPVLVPRTPARRRAAGDPALNAKTPPRKRNTAA